MIENTNHYSHGSETERDRRVIHLLFVIDGNPVSINVWMSALEKLTLMFATCQAPEKFK